MAGPGVDVVPGLNASGGPPPAKRAENGANEKRLLFRQLWEVRLRLCWPDG